MFGQSIFDISVLNVGLVTLLDSVGSGLASLPVVDGLDVVGLALRTGGGVVGSTAGVICTVFLIDQPISVSNKMDPSDEDTSVWDSAFE